MVETANRNGRSEDQILGVLAGHVPSGLAVSLGGESRFLRPLSLKSERTWKETVSKVATKAATDLDGLNLEVETTDMLAAVLGSNIDDAVNLVMDFDSLGDGALNRDWLEEHASGIEIRETLEVLLDSVYPPMPGTAMRPGRILLSLILAGAAARSASPPSTSAFLRATAGSGASRASKKR